MNKDELKAKYARIANDPSQLEMFKDDVINGDVLTSVPEPTIEDAGKVLKVNEEGVLEYAEGGSPAPTHPLNDLLGLHDLFEEIAISVEPISYDETFEFDRCSGAALADMFTAFDTELAKRVISLIDGYNFETDEYDLPKTMFIDANIHGCKAFDNTKLGFIQLFAEGYDHASGANIPCQIEVQINAETGDETIVATPIFDIFSGTIRVVYDPEGVLLPNTWDEENKSEDVGE